MATATTELAALRPAPSTLGRFGRSTWLFIRKKPLGAIGAVLLLVMAVAAVGAPVLERFPPLLFHPSDTLTPPNGTYWLGSDDKGRDIYSRIIWGARISLQVGFVAVAFGTTIGLVLGLLSGYLGGRFDSLIQRTVDSFQAFPALLLALAITTALKARDIPDVVKVGVALALATWPTACRVIRSSVLAHKGTMYVEAARSIGARTPRIMFLHILPNIASIYIILATAGLAQAILTEASLSFLGAGVPPPEPSWGGMLLEAQRQATRAPWMAIFPGVAITVAVFGFNLFGDALRDTLDPRLRGSR
jgi:peptide/nickel transport system permease protein